RISLSPVRFLFLLSPSCAHLDIHSFPTRRSSDLFHFGTYRRIHLFFGLKQLVLCLVFGNLGLSFFLFLQKSCPLPPHIPFVSELDRKSTRLNSSHVKISYAVFCLKKKTKTSLTTI